VDDLAQMEKSTSHEIRVIPHRKKKYPFPGNKIRYLETQFTFFTSLLKPVSK
jgi:hypothetical protein